MVVYPRIDDREVKRIKNKSTPVRWRVLLLVFLLFYLFTVLWYTVLSRSIDYQPARFELFRSYRRWFAGDAELGRQIILNILMLVPFGFLLSAVLPAGSGRRKSLKRAVAVLAFALLFSLTIEALQRFLVRGLFELDDLLDNVIGALLGILLYGVIERMCPVKRLPILAVFVGLFAALICLIVLIRGNGDARTEGDPASKMYCFQVDSALMDGDTLEMTGFAFRYDRPDETPAVILRSTDTGKETRLSISCGLARPDVSQYFSCEYDYSYTGFTAKGAVEPEQEYEILVWWPWSVPTSSGVYIRGGRVHYAPEQGLELPDTAATDLDAILKNAVLRVFRPDCHCWIYQDGGALYWIMDSGYPFEEDGTTYIQYQLWTTQTRRLPEKRLARNNFWDNIGGYFEDHELTGDFGPYRVMKRELPTAYSVTSIITGYYQNGSWLWKHAFRPLYTFQNDSQSFPVQVSNTETRVEANDTYENKNKRRIRAASAVGSLLFSVL